MQMKSNIKLFTIWGAIILLFKWFEPNTFTIFGPFFMLPPLAALFLWSLAYGVWSIVILVKNVKAARVRAAIPLAIFLMVSALTLFVSFEPAKVRMEHMIYRNAREKIVSLIQNEELTVNDWKIIRLPSGYRRLSATGNAQIFVNDEQEVIVGFWVRTGILNTPCRMIVYTSYGESPSEETPGINRFFGSRKIEENWYFVVVW
jgi:hypothetical protein